MMNRSIKVNLNAYAKVNLSLKIMGVRADGYHLLDSYFQLIDIHDDICIELIPRANVANVAETAEATNAAVSTKAAKTVDSTKAANATKTANAVDSTKVAGSIDVANIAETAEATETVEKSINTNLEYNSVADNAVSSIDIDNIATIDFTVVDVRK
ncbi:MAG: hypothetical protein LBN22_12090, partial [Clostridiales Family XIII bacterium]|nr:hypothetical protein [Clostridiales Family XIII bacterium]